LVFGASHSCVASPPSNDPNRTVEQHSHPGPRARPRARASD